MAFSLLQKPKEAVVFIDTSALLSILGINSKHDPKCAETYQKLFSELLPKWEIIGIISPLVILETINALQTICLVEHCDMPIKDVQRIKTEMAKNKKLYDSKWKKAHSEAIKYFQLIIELIEKAENIICEDYPGDDAHFTECKQFLPALNNAGPEAPSPADLFHLHFMKKNNCKSIIAQDKHFASVPNIDLYTFSA